MIRMSKIQKNKIVSIGDEETSLGFKLAGISAAYTVEASKAAPVLRKISNDPDIAVVIITEEVAAVNASLIKKLKQKPFPVFVEVPGKKARFEKTEDEVRALIKMALGVDIEF